MRNQVISFFVCAIIGFILWNLPVPEGLTEQAIHLFAIFVFTILGLILKPLPMGAVSMIGMTLLVATKVLKFEEAFSGFSHPVVWLIVCAFFISRGFIKTGLGERIALHLMKLLGKTTLGMGYGIVATDLILAPAIPSITARAGGIVFPILNSLVRAFGSHPHDGPRKMGAYLMLTAFQGSVVTSAMFLTSMAGNPLAADLATDVGIDLTWGTWALYASVPGLLSLLVIPYVLYKIYPPTTKKTPHAALYAKKQLLEMGRFSLDEKILVVVFAVIVGLWVLGPFIKMKAVVAALIGLVGLLLTKVLGWDDVLKEKSAWDTLAWFAGLVMMAGYLNKLGMTKWFSQWVVANVHGFNWVLAFGIIVLVYFYSHYFFASNIAHIGAMYPPFLALAVAVGTPPLLAALALAFFSNLFGGLTHYGCGAAPIIFGAGYVPIQKWWQYGFIISVVNIVIWLGIGGPWWHLLSP